MTDKTFLITDEIPTKTCPLWDATHDPEPGDGMCRIKVLSCRMGGNKYPQAPWLGCATLRDHIRQWHEAVFGARNDKCTLITGEATGTTGVQNLVGLLDAYGLSADYCPNYDATAPGNKRCSLHVGSECEPDDCKVLDRIRKKRKADSEPQAGVCPHVEDRMDGDVCGIDYQENECRQGRDLDIWPYCTKLPNPKEPRHGNVTTFTGQPPVKDPEHARLDYRIGEVGKFLDKHRKRLDILESLHAAAVQNLGERCDDTERKIMGIVGEYGVGLANLNVDLAKRSNLMGERLEAIEQQLGNVTLRSKDMDNRLAALEETISRSVVPRGHIIALDDGLAALEAAVKEEPAKNPPLPEMAAAMIGYEDGAMRVRFKESGHEVVIARDLQPPPCPKGKFMTDIDGRPLHFICMVTGTRCYRFINGMDRKYEDCDTYKSAPRIGVQGYSWTPPIEQAAPRPAEDKGAPDDNRCPHASPEPTLVDGKRRFFDCAITGNKCEEKRCVGEAWRECEHATPSDRP